MKKVLIITYYWPPAGGAGVQRWLKFVKYLRDFGWEPVIYTAKNPSYPILDNSLFSEIPENIEVIKTKIWEPYKFAERFNKKNKDYKAGHLEKRNKQSFLSKISIFIRGNFFIPDARRAWVKPSVRFLQGYLKSNQIETVITTGPPHSLHLIGLHLTKQNPNLKWIADFRDPWTQINYHSQLKLTYWAKQKHKELEQKVIQNAHLIISTSYTDAENFKKLGAKKIEIITNGYDNEIDTSQKQKSDTFRIVYAGGLEITRNPQVLWNVLSELIKENPDFKDHVKLIFYGTISKDVEHKIKELNLQNYIEKKGYVSHQESIKGIVNADLLWLTNFDDPKSKGIIPGKLFEYLATQNPIIAIGPKDGDVARVLENTNVGAYFAHQDEDKLKDYLSSLYQKYKTGALKTEVNDIEKYSRRHLTRELSKVLDSLD